tara:strand:+ start:1436 stop:1915 length:480 start_codon:yes stop_codon:yes gene_type:complete
MTTKVNDVYEVDSQFLTGSLAHFTTTCADMDEGLAADYAEVYNEASAAKAATIAAKAAWDADPGNAGLETAYDNAVIAEAAAVAAEAVTLTALNEHKAAVKRAVHIVEGRSTLVVMGAVATPDLRVAVENNGTWTAVSLAAELNAGWAGSAWTVAAFAY